MNQNQPKFLLCSAWTSEKARRLFRLGFSALVGKCSDCSQKLLISPAGARLLATDALVQPICVECADGKQSETAAAEYQMTGGQMREFAELFAKLRESGEE